MTEPNPKSAQAGTLRFTLNGVALRSRFLKKVSGYADRLYQAKPLEPGQESAMAFIMGCGRSGITVLGEVLALHPRVRYFMEPRERWMAMESRYDIWGYLATPNPRSLILTEENVRPGSVEKFNLLFRRDGPDRTVIEKTPENLFRTRWLNALAPDARFIGIERHPYRVIHSIVQAAKAHVPYGWTGMNNWYGAKRVKEKALVQTALSLGMDPSMCFHNRGSNHWSSSVGMGPSTSFHSPNDWAALEWLLSQGVMEEARSFLGDRLQVVRYETLLEQPQETLAQLFEFLQLVPEPDVIQAACATLRTLTPLPPPPRLCKEMQDLLEASRFL